MLLNRIFDHGLIKEFSSKTMSEGLIPLQKNQEAG